MKFYPDWRTNILVFLLLITLVGGYFFRQTRKATGEFEKHSRDHSEILAAVVELNLRNALLAKSGLEEIVAGSLENSARFIRYLDAIEPFSPPELTAFAVESGLAGVKITGPVGRRLVSGPDGWLPGRTCTPTGGLERLGGEQLYLYSFPVRPVSGDIRQGCILVGVSSEEIDATLEKISIERLLSLFNNLHDISSVRFGGGPSGPVDRGDVVETTLTLGGKPLIIALKADRFGKRRREMQKEFAVFLVFLILIGLFSSWWLYRIQHFRLEQTREFERKMASQRKDAALGRATATITHELRNPLNGISMGLQRLQLEGANLDEEHHGLVVSMRNAVDRADGIITRLRQSIHAFEVSPKRLNLADCINQVVTLYRSRCEEQRITVEINGDTDILVAGDRILLGQLFENLMKNGMEAQPRGGYVNIVIRRLDHTCQVEIMNGGFELSEEESRLLFEPYFTSKSTGTGLGLVISRKIVRAHRGTLTFQADFAQKSVRFFVTLPLAAKVND